MSKYFTVRLGASTVAGQIQGVEHVVSGAAQESNRALPSSVIRMMEGARRIRQMSGDGALHIFVEDGNCDDDDLTFCDMNPELRPEEAAFLKWMREEITEEERFGAWAIANDETFESSYPS